MRKAITLFVSILLTVEGMAQLIPGLNGEGTQDDPVKITSLSDLQVLSAFVRNDPDRSTDTKKKNTYGKYFKVMNNIDMSADAAFVPIGGCDSYENYRKRYFAGAFDGNNRVISNLTVNAPEMEGCGLFGCIDNALIQNLTLENINVTGDGSTGGLCGLCDNSSLIRNCHTSGSVTGGSYVGGICGNNGVAIHATIGGEKVIIGANNQILNCSSTANVHGTALVGGLCGANEYTRIINCAATGRVSGGLRIGGLCGEIEYSSVISGCHTTGDVTGTGRFYIGGLCGSISESYVENCYATGSIKGTGTETGGFCGINFKSVITQCFATGTVEGIKNVGGFCGLNQWNAIITDCYATGTVGGNGENIGGFCGEIGSVNIINGQRDASSISRSYATGNVSGYFSTRGGFAGFKNDGSDNSMCYYLVSATGDNSGGTPKTLEEMKNQAFVNLLNADSNPAPWQSDVTPNVNLGFPILTFYAETLPTGIQSNHAIKNLQLSSNPVVSGQTFTVKSNKSFYSGNAKIEIYTITGLLIDTIDATGVYTNVTLNVAPGIYILKLQNELAKVVVK